MLYTPEVSHDSKSSHWKHDWEKFVRKYFHLQPMQLKPERFFSGLCKRIFFLICRMNSCYVLILALLSSSKPWNILCHPSIRTQSLARENAAVSSPVAIKSFFNDSSFLCPSWITLAKHVTFYPLREIFLCSCQWQPKSDSGIDIPHASLSQLQKTKTLLLLRLEEG